MTRQSVTRRIASEKYAFGHWRFDADSGDLHDGKTSIRLEPQVGKLLAHFLNHQGRVVSRDELIADVWNGRVVSDDAINRCVSILRQTLSPNDRQAYIETVVRKGYLAHFPAPPVVSPQQSSPSRHNKHLLIVVFAGLLALGLYFTVFSFDGLDTRVPASIPNEPPMVAVLPFAFSGQAADSQFFADGMHADLLTRLSKLQSMRVISSTSVMAYRNVTRNIRKIGKELGADVILEGNVQVTTDRIRINAQLIDARTDAHVWAETYDRELSPANLFQVQSDIARRITEQLNAELSPQDGEQLALIPTASMEAYRAYHRAMQMRDQSGAAISSEEYRQALEEAVELDPAFSRAWAELVSALAFANFQGGRPDMTLRAEWALRQLKAVAPGTADHLLGQGAYLYYALRDYDRAHNIVSKALVMNPSNVRAVELRSWIERRQGDFDAYLLSKREALRLDPRNMSSVGSFLRGLMITHQYDEAQLELEGMSSINSFTSSAIQNLLLFREQPDFARLQESMQGLCGIYREPDCGWYAHIANRNYAGALASLETVEDPVQPAEISTNLRRRIMTYWLMEENEIVAQGIPQWSSELDADLDESGNYRRSRSYIMMALLAGIQGNRAKSELYIERWRREEPLDWAERSLFRHEACRILGLIGATQAAVACIRDGLEEPSYVTPFLEPYLPFYDPIRHDQKFLEMLAEVEESGL